MVGFAVGLSQAASVSPTNHQASGMSPLLPKIAAFWLIVHGALWLLRRMPNSRAARIAFSWQGPVPVEGEKRSSFHRRQAMFAIGWLVQILSVGAVALLITRWLPASGDSETAPIAVAFALTIGAGMSLLGAVLAGCASAKAVLFGPNPEFRSNPCESLSNVNELEH